MSEMTDAFDELLTVDEEVFGSAGSVTINSVAYDCFFPDSPSNFELVSGGVRDGSTPEAWVKKSLFGGTPPQEGQTAVIGSRSLVVLGPIIDRKAYYVVTLGLTYES